MPRKVKEDGGKQAEEKVLKVKVKTSLLCRWDVTSLPNVRLCLRVSKVRGNKRMC